MIEPTQNLVMIVYPALLGICSAIVAQIFVMKRSPDISTLGAGAFASVFVGYSGYFIYVTAFVFPETGMYLGMDATSLLVGALSSSVFGIPAMCIFNLVLFLFTKREISEDE